MKKIILIIILNFILTSNSQAKHLYLESWYQDKYCEGQKELVLEDNTRVDCLMGEYAVEFDFADKWAECIGQALFYAKMTNKKPACFLIIENTEKDLKYLQRLDLVAPKYNIKIFNNLN